MRELCQASLRVCTLNSCSCKHIGITVICIYIVKNIWFARFLVGFNDWFQSSRACQTKGTHRMRLVEVGDATCTRSTSTTTNVIYIYLHTPVVPLKQPSSTRSLVFTVSGSTGNLFQKQRRTQLQTRMQLRERKVGDAKGRVKLSMFMSNSSID
ncbi:hypothetical protein DEU56DRAFT_324813 [Suillus clintonianus]|uniref:uncharacterized protein n=1 Tax=Suillus clintonianus TaxID=1904413 RepID=UPI001B86B9EE|nr:uncharacterized protein DEU56DRAFT_324813 [Suillus clintonianus]KAG2139266.1 hypothetical protein DEU56DRAFT_324813 [Suillus clintonianus]